MMEANGREESGIGEVVDIGEDGSMMCTKHPNNNYNNNNNNNPGGICAVCLQEKLGNLISSSLPIATFPPSSSTSSRSESTRISFGHSQSTNNGFRHWKPRIPFLSAYSKKNANANVTLQRSKSTAAASLFPERRRSFWSFLYYSRRGGLNISRSSSSINRVVVSSGTTTTTRASSVMQGTNNTIVIAEEEEEEEVEQEDNPAPTSHTHTHSKVSRSRSVGCAGGGGGSRSFSGDFFERLGECRIRRVESQRHQSNSSDQIQHKCMKERVRCGGIFGGFNLTSSSSSCSTSSQWVPSTTSAVEEANIGTGRMNGMDRGRQVVQQSRRRSWAWALASPLRAFTNAKPTTSTFNNNNTPPPPSFLLN